MSETKFSINWKMLGMFYACLGVLFFSVLVYENHQTIIAQKHELSRLTRVAKDLEWERSELNFIRNALVAREPYYYESSLREDWGYRKKGEKLISELPARHYISKGVPIYEVKTRKNRAQNWLQQTVFFLLAGLAISGIAFLLFSSAGVREKDRPDPILQMRDFLFKKRREVGGDNFND